MLHKLLHSVLLLAVAAPVPPAHQTVSPEKSTPTAAKVLTAVEAAKYLPAEVFFRGQSAPVQTRNSSGVQFTKDSLLLVALVDTAGYSSAVQEKYQAYLITETPIEVEGHQLAPGAYGCGFLAADAFVVMDIGGHDLFSVHSAKDTDLRRPTPLQILPSTDDSGYRLYFGRNYVKFSQQLQ